MKVECHDAREREASGGDSNNVRHYYQRKIIVWKYKLRW